MNRLPAGLRIRRQVLMKESLKIRTISILIAGILPAAALMGQQVTIDISGSWSLTITSADLTAGAGSDFTSSYESNTDQISVDIDKVVSGNFWDWFLSYNWRVDVNKQDVNWHSDMELYVRRTSGGFGFGSISGGTSYQQITSSDRTFFSGNGRRYWIPLQLQLQGMSVEVPPGNYSTVVYYTVTEL